MPLTDGSRFACGYTVSFSLVYVYRGLRIYLYSRRLVVFLATLLRWFVVTASALANLHVSLVTLSAHRLGG